LIERHLAEHFLDLLDPTHHRDSQVKVSSRRLVSARPQLRLITRPADSAAPRCLLLQRAPISPAPGPPATAVLLPRGETISADAISSPGSSRPSAPCLMLSSCLDIQPPSDALSSSDRVRAEI